MNEFKENSTNRAKQETVRRQHEQNIEKDKQNKKKRLSEKERKGRQQGTEEVRRIQEEIKRKQAMQEAERAGKPDSRQPNACSRTEHVTQSQELRDLANSQKQIETLAKIKSHDDMKNRERIEDYNYLKDKVDALDKVERSMTECKDKSLLKKHQARKNGIERDIGREYGIYRDKPRLFQSKAETERQAREYRERISKKLEQLKEGKEQAEKSLAENKTTRKDIDFEAHRREVQRRAQAHIKAQEHERPSRSR